MTIKAVDVYPSPLYDTRPTCEGRLTRWVAEQNERWRKRAEKDKTHSRRRSKRFVDKIPDGQCANSARYKINAHWYCRKHGALIALDLVAEKVKP